jgi:hypothetical protein
MPPSARPSAVWPAPKPTAPHESSAARKVLALLDEFRAHGARLDEAAHAVVAAYNEFREQACAIRVLGAGNFSEQALRVASRRALVAALIGTEVEVLAPRERHSWHRALGNREAALKR